MIKSFGLHWHLDKVDWGKQNANGTLLGADRRTAKANPVDFRSQRGIYVLYADYELVYIGQTGAKEQTLFNRLKHHKKDHLSERWNRFSWFGILDVNELRKSEDDNFDSGNSISSKAGKGKDTQITTIEALNVLEAISIAIAEPRLNLQRGKWGNAKQYYQC